MTMNFPAVGLKVEIEFVSGSFTDVTADFNASIGYVISRPRSTANQQPSQPQPGTLTLTLENPTGKYTPGRQVLTDGTAAPYYPNVVRRKRIRLSYSAGGQVRFLGYIQRWQPVPVNGVLTRTQITAIDRANVLSKAPMLAPIAQEISADSFAPYWPLTDQTGSANASEQSGVGAVLTTAKLGAGGGTLAFGDNGPGFGDGTGVKFAPTARTNGIYLTGSTQGFPSQSGLATWEVFINMPAVPAATVGVLAVITQLAGAPANLRLEVNTSGQVVLTGVSTGTGLAFSLTGTSNICDGSWHCVQFTPGSAGVGSSITVDTVVQASGGDRLYGYGANLPIMVGATVESGIMTGNLGRVGVKDGPLSAARITAHYQAMLGYAGDTVDARIKRFLGYAGLTSADWNIDASVVTLGAFPQSGKSVMSACQDMAVTEGAGSVFYIDPTGAARFKNRSYRKPLAPTLTLDGVADLAGDVFQPQTDDQRLVNQAQAIRANQAGTVSTQTVNNAASQAPTVDGLAGVIVTTYTQTDTDALHLAQQVVTDGLTTVSRLDQVAVDLITAQNNLLASVAATGIGDRIRLTNLATASVATGQIDLLVEGWTETGNINSVRLVYDTSPADAPRRGVWGDGTTITDVSYSRWTSNGLTLSGAITNTATTVVIASSDVTFTTNAAMYPMDIQIGAERITLTGVPGGSTSPQTFTACTRGAHGTTASAQSNSAAVTLPAAGTWTL